MLVKILGACDLMSALWIMLLHFDVLGSNQIGFFFGIYLVVKGYLFRENLVSYVDLFAGVYLILMGFGISNFLSYLFAIWLAQKSLVSLFG